MKFINFDQIMTCYSILYMKIEQLKDESGSWGMVQVHPSDLRRRGWSQPSRTWSGQSACFRWNIHIFLIQKIISYQVIAEIQNSKLKLPEHGAECARARNGMCQSTEWKVPKYGGARARNGKFLTTERNVPEHRAEVPEHGAEGATAWKRRCRSTKQEVLKHRTVWMERMARFNWDIRGWWHSDTSILFLNFEIQITFWRPVWHSVWQLKQADTAAVSPVCSSRWCTLPI